MEYYVGVDVGTGSVRAALVSNTGKVLDISTHPIETYHPFPDFYEQSSDNIWNSICSVVKKITKGIALDQIKGIGFDATCSLVALDTDGNPVTVSLTGNKEQNVILWMDHRAKEEAELINRSNHEMLKYVGGKISLEMETPKMLWLKKNLPDTWNQAKLLFDLPDFLTWRATGSESRSLCSLVCKWNYNADSNSSQWNLDFFSKIGLADLQENNWRRIGNKVQAPGQPVGSGLSKKAAQELNLLPGTPVGTSIIDAHAGGLGMIGCSVPGISSDLTSRIGLICGTSTCHMVVSEKKIFVEGVWGPYYSAMVPEMWLNEGGQSATGKLLDHIIESHPATKSIREKIGNQKHIQQYLSELLKSMAKDKHLKHISYLTENLHVWPDFHGNRSPLADPSLLGMVSGLSLSTDEGSLAKLYLATMQALTYGTKLIIESLTKAGHKIESVLICGGLSQNPLFVETQADVLNLPVICPIEKESVLVGAATLGAYAAGCFPTIFQAVQKMGGSGDVVKPTKSVHPYHCRKYKVYKKMVEDQLAYRKMMNLEDEQ